MISLPLDDFLVFSRLKSDNAKTHSKEFAFSKQQWRSLEEKRELRGKLRDSKKKNKLNSNIPDEYKRTKKIAPVELAAATGHTELTRFLLSRYFKKCETM
jgi:hypothetical protein